MRVHFLTTQNVLAIHDAMLARYGGQAGILKPGELDASIHSPQATYDGVPLYEDVFGVAAAYLFMAVSHPFNDGNKRTAWETARVFLQMNGVEMKKIRTQDAVTLMINIVTGTEKDWRVVAVWLRKRAR